MKLLISTAVATICLFGAPNVLARPTDRQDISRAKVEAFLAALSGGDEKTYNALTTPDYRAFENGRIYDRKAFFNLVQKGIRDGMRPKFYMTDARSTIGDRVASINYLNHGSYATPSGFKDITWLEVVTLQYVAGVWRIDFLDSQVSTEDRR